MNRLRLFIIFIVFILISSVSSFAQETTSPVKIGWIMDSRGMGDGGFNDAVNTVLSEISQKQPVTIVRVPRLDLYADKTVADLLAVGVSIVIASDEGGMNGAMSEAARKNPDVKFILVGTEGAPLTNLASIIFEEDEAGYMAGFMAGTITKTNKLGFIGGAVFDPILRFERGFVAGAADANRDAEVTSEYIEKGEDVAGLYDRDKTNQTVLKLAKKGVDVIFAVSGTGTLGAISAAEKTKIAVIGLRNDEAKLAPTAVAASVIYRFDTAVKKSVLSALAGNPIGGVYLMSFANGGLDVTALSRDLGADKIRKITERKTLLAAGKVSVPDYLTERRKTKLVVSLNIDMPPYELYLRKAGSPATSLTS